MPEDPRLHPRARLNPAVPTRSAPPPTAASSRGDDAVDARVDAIDALLPQTQCTKCGHGGCRPYATAIVRGDAPIDRCPPGGAAGIALLSAATGRPVVPLDPACGVEAPRRVARIIAELCIGCTKCIQACPVDAIAGATKRLHAVIPELCTGCDLCVAPCPTDCIEMIAPPPALAGWSRADADAARMRHRRRAERLERVDRETRQRLAGEARAQLASLELGPQDAAVARKRAVVEAAIARARARLEDAR
ncbi:MAG: RnfABCDGE type electron transport complex subunit B [Burkholderiales bacterium]